jgi:hypothetical protein
MVVKKQHLLLNLYADITMVVKKTTTSITRPICRYCNGCKKNQHLLQDLYVSIAYLKWPYGNYNRKDVSIAQCSF